MIITTLRYFIFHFQLTVCIEIVPKSATFQNANTLVNVEILSNLTKFQYSSAYLRTYSTPLKKISVMAVYVNSGNLVMPNRP